MVNNDDRLDVSTNRVLLLALMLLSVITSCAKPATTATEEAVPAVDMQHALTEQQRFMLESLEKTPYFALVEYLDVKTEALSDDDPNDDFVEEEHIFTAKVLKVYRGTPSETMTYTSISEKGEQVDIPSGPVLISLCRNESGFYWPGVGARFPATKENLALIEALRKDASHSQESYSFCDD